MLYVFKRHTLIVLFWWACVATLCAYQSTAIAVYDVDAEQFLYRKNSETRRAPASTIKVLAALTAWKNNDDKDKYVTISRHAAAAEPTRADLKEGDQYHLKDLIKLALVASCNDAARALAEGTSGSESKFAQDMQAMAKSLGTKSTFITNASGLPSPEGMVTTCVDNIKILCALKNIPELVEVLNSKTISIVSKTGQRINKGNHNRLLNEGFAYPVLGKTGFTNLARHCFLSFCEYKGRTIAVCILGAPKSSVLWDELRQLYRTYMNRSVQSQGLNAYMINNHISLTDLHEALQRSGFPLEKSENVYGSYTKKAMSAFQKSHQLLVDGILGPQTWGVLKK